MSSKPNLLLIGIEPEVSKVISDLLSSIQVSTLPMDMDHLIADHPEKPLLVISGPAQKNISSAELAQVLRMQFQNIPIFMVCSNRKGFERKEFIKNGFTDAFLIPLDTSLFRQVLSETLSALTQGALHVYRPVKIIDLEPGVSLGFDVNLFLPANKKFIKVSKSGDDLDVERIEKIKKGNFTCVHVPAEQMTRFYEYSAKRLRELGKHTFSSTEKKEKLSHAVRELISGIFTEEASSFDSGQGVLRDCGEIVKTYILQGAENEWYIRIQQVLGERGDNYSHASNVSTLAALFSMGLGIGKPEDLALAGLLHDIGISDLPAEIQTLDVHQMSQTQFDLYKKHPALSVSLIKARKIVVPESVTKMILQHHELYNGSGYPNGYFGDRISKEAQLLALADQFDYLTRVTEGRPLLSPAEAVEKLRNEQINDPSKIHYSPEILKKLLTLFPESKKMGI